MSYELVFYQGLVSVGSLLNPLVVMLCLTAQRTGWRGLRWKELDLVIRENALIWRVLMAIAVLLNLIVNFGPWALPKAG